MKLESLNHVLMLEAPPERTLLAAHPLLVLERLDPPPARR
jgi:hypothetical protein